MSYIKVNICLVYTSTSNCYKGCSRLHIDKKLLPSTILYKMESKAKKPVVNICLSCLKNKDCNDIKNNIEFESKDGEIYIHYKDTSSYHYDHNYDVLLDTLNFNKITDIKIKTPKKSNIPIKRPVLQLQLQSIKPIQPIVNQQVVVKQQQIEERQPIINDEGKICMEFCSDYYSLGKCLHDNCNKIWLSPEALKIYKNKRKIKDYIRIVFICKNYWNTGICNKVNCYDVHHRISQQYDNDTSNKSNNRIDVVSANVRTEKEKKFCPEFLMYECCTIVDCEKLHINLTELVIYKRKRNIPAGQNVSGIIVCEKYEKGICSTEGCINFHYKSRNKSNLKTVSNGVNKDKKESKIIQYNLNEFPSLPTEESNNEFEPGSVNNTIVQLSNYWLKKDITKVDNLNKIKDEIENSKDETTNLIKVEVNNKDEDIIQQLIKSDKPQIIFKNYITNLLKIQRDEKNGEKYCQIFDSAKITYADFLPTDTQINTEVLRCLGVSLGPLVKLTSVFKLKSTNIKSVSLLEMYNSIKNQDNNQNLKQELLNERLELLNKQFENYLIELFGLIYGTRLCTILKTEYVDLDLFVNKLITTENLVELGVAPHIVLALTIIFKLN